MLLRRSLFRQKRSTVDSWRVMEVEEEKTLKDTVRKRDMEEPGITFCTIILQKAKEKY